MTARCADCRHWGGRDGVWSIERPAWGRCKRSEGDPRDAETLAYGSAFTEMGYGCMVTAPEFGCVMFEAASPEEARAEGRGQ